MKHDTVHETATSAVAVGQHAAGPAEASDTPQEAKTHGTLERTGLHVLGHGGKSCGPGHRRDHRRCCGQMIGLWGEEETRRASEVSRVIPHSTPPQELRTATATATARGGGEHERCDKDKVYRGAQHACGCELVQALTEAS